MATLKSFSIDGRTVKSLFINGKPVKLGAEPVEYAGLCFTAEEADSSVQLTKVGSAPDVLLETSTNGRTWHHYEVGDVINLTNAGDKVYIKAMGSNDSFGSSTVDYHLFVMTGRIAASGNIHSLLNENFEDIDTVTDYCYCKLFYNCSSLIAAPELPATTLAGYCYTNMFYNCSSLIAAPELPAETLAGYCYHSMFSRCSSLTQTPELPATTLANNCYQNMFSGCTSLTMAPELPATTLAPNCYSQMFNSCTSLTTVPNINATTLQAFVGNQMFNGCTLLNSVKVAFTDWVNGIATPQWLQNVTSTGTFYCKQALIDATTTRNASTVPSSWTMVAV